MSLKYKDVLHLKGSNPSETWYKVALMRLGHLDSGCGPPPDWGWWSRPLPPPWPSARGRVRHGAWRRLESIAQTVNSGHPTPPATPRTSAVPTIPPWERPGSELTSCLRSPVTVPSGGTGGPAGAQAWTASPRVTSTWLESLQEVGNLDPDAEEPRGDGGRDCRDAPTGRGLLVASCGTRTNPTGLRARRPPWDALRAGRGRLVRGRATAVPGGGLAHGERKHQPHGSGGESGEQGGFPGPRRHLDLERTREPLPNHISTRTHTFSPQTADGHACHLDSPSAEETLCVGWAAAHPAASEATQSLCKVTGGRGVLAASLGQVENAAKSGHVSGQDATSTFSITNTRNTEGLLCGPTVHSLIRRNTGHNSWV